MEQCADDSQERCLFLCFFFFPVKIQAVLLVTAGNIVSHIYLLRFLSGCDKTSF